jgi:hypothetical protein
MGVFKNKSKRRTGRRLKTIYKIKKERRRKRGKYFPLPENY